MSHLSWRFGALCAAAIATSAPFIAQGQGAAPRAGARAPEKPLPLEVGRTFSLDTREGTWLSLDVSPDGTTIAFDMLGDLYTMPFAGGDATRITSGMAFDAQPRFSPDGKSIVYWAKGGLHRVDIATRQVVDIAFHVQDTRRVTEAVRTPVARPFGSSSTVGLPAPAATAT